VGSGGIAPLILWGEWSASRPCRFTPKERAPGTHWIGGWVGPRAVLDGMLYWYNWMKPKPLPYFYNISSNSIFPSTPRSLKWSLPFSFSDQNVILISHLPNACYMSRQPHLPSYVHPNSIWWRVKVKIKVKFPLYFNWAPRHEGVLGDWRCSSAHSLPRH
jgi:hypothetical protein